MTLRGLSAYAAAAFLALGACKSDEAAPKYPDSAAFCSAKAQAECKVAASVCGLTAAVCTSARVALCTRDAEEAAADGRVFTSDKVDDCLAKTAAAYADRVPDPGREAAYDEACARVFAGTRPLSAACTNAYACVDGLVCDLTKGFCGTESVKNNNEGCNNPGDTCAKGLFCQARGSARFCSAKAKVGDVCSEAIPCDDDLRCDRVCMAKIQIGNPCASSDECVTGLCNAQKACAARQFPSATGTCADFGGT